MRTPPIAIRQPRAVRISPLVAAVALAFGPAAALASPLEVTSTLDSGANSLREAILFANANCATAPSPAITFNIPGSGPFTIAPSSPLPAFQCPSNPYFPTVNGGGNVLDGSSSNASCGLSHNFTAGGNLAIQGTTFQNFRNATCSIGDSSPLSSLKAAIAGPAVLISPTTVRFGEVEVDTSSSERVVIVRSAGDAAYEISDIVDSSFMCYGVYGGPAAAPYGGGICAYGSFTCSTTCEPNKPYANGALCKVTATFTPPYVGFHSTTVYLCDNTSTSPNLIVFEGYGGPPPPIRMSPTRWDFGDVPVGEASDSHRFTITNTNTYDYGGTPVIIEATGDFKIVSDDCDGVMSANSSCNVFVEFAPTVPGEARGDLSVTIDEFCDCADVAAVKLGGTPAAKAALFGNGLAGGELALPESINLGTAIYGGSAVSRTIEVSNIGNEPVTFSNVSVSSLFTLVNNCPAVLEAGQVCTLVIGFTAPGVGPFTGTLNVMSDASAEAVNIPLSALGETSVAPLLQLEPRSIGFGDRVIGSSSSTQQVTIRNVGGAVATLSLAISTIDFTLNGNTCTGTLEPQATCFAQVAFRPLGFGLRPGALIVTSNATGSPQSVALAGTGCRPFVASGNRSGSNSNCAP